MEKIIYIVNCIYDDETGYGLNQRVFNTYEEAEKYAEETIENAESEYSTEVDREQNVYAVITNRWNDAKGFIEITSVVLPSEEASEYNKQQKNIKEMEW